MTTTGPTTDAEIRGYLDSLGVPGLADLHVHFMPDSVMSKVWSHFEDAQAYYGTAWPVQYRGDEADRVDRLRSFGVAEIPALNYAHRPGMARWLNDWSTQFARRVDGAVHCATMYAEPGVEEYVAQALDAGARLWKVHVDVGDFSPDDPLLDGAWGLLAEAGVPVVTHAGSGPHRGRYTGPEPVERVLRRHRDLTLVIAHLGLPEYHQFADLAERYPRVHLDTTMAATEFMDHFAALPAGYLPRLADLGHKVVLGSDFPNIPHPYAHQLEALARLDLGDEWMRNVLWHNGSRLLNG